MRRVPDRVLHTLYSRDVPPAYVCGHLCGFEEHHIHVRDARHVPCVDAVSCETWCSGRNIWGRCDPAERQSKCSSSLCLLVLGLPSKKGNGRSGPPDRSHGPKVATLPPDVPARHCSSTATAAHVKTGRATQMSSHEMATHSGGTRSIRAKTAMSDWGTFRRMPSS